MEWLADSEPPAFMTEIDEILILEITLVFDHINKSALAIKIITYAQYKSKY